MVLKERGPEDPDGNNHVLECIFIPILTSLFV